MMTKSSNLPGRRHIRSSSAPQQIALRREAVDLGVVADYVDTSGLEALFMKVGGSAMVFDSRRVFSACRRRSTSTNGACNPFVTWSPSALRKSPTGGQP